MANQYRSVLASSGPAPTGGDALPAEVLSGKTFTNDNGAQTGTMTNNGAVTQTLSAGQSYTVPEGYHNGNGVVTADEPALLGVVLTVTDPGWMAHGSIITSDGNIETQTSAETFTLTNGDFTLTKLNNTTNNATFTATRNCKLIDATGAVAYTITANVPASVVIGSGWVITE